MAAIVVRASSLSPATPTRCKCRSEEDGQVFANYMFMNVNARDAPMAAKIVVSGRIPDTVAKTVDGWKIARRFVRFDQNVVVTE